MKEYKSFRTFFYECFPELVGVYTLDSVLQFRDCMALYHINNPDLRFAK